MNQGYFITGTDTDAGKTWATIALMHYFKQQGKSVAGMKPVAAGCRLRCGQLQNDDALLMQQHASIPVDYRLINPYAYELPVSPHLAGRHDPVDMHAVLAGFKQLKALADIVLVEGAGGWYAPVNRQEDVSDLAKMLALPVIIVVAIRLGCINHAKLTYRAVQHSRLHCAGWIAVCVDADMLMREETIQTIATALDAPLLGILPYLERADFHRLAEQLAGL